MNCRRLCAFGFSDELIGKIVKLLGGSWLQLESFHPRGLQELFAWIDKADNRPTADYFFIDAERLFGRQLRGVDVLREAEAAISYVDEELMPLLDRFRPLTFCGAFKQVFVFTGFAPAGQPGLWSGLVYDRIRKKDDFYAVQLTPDDLRDLARRVPIIRNMDPKDQAGLLKKAASEEGVTFDEGILTSVILTFPDFQEVTRAYQERCQNFFFLYSLSLGAKGKLKKVRKDKLELLQRRYNFNSLESELKMCKTRRAIASRFDLQLIKVIDGLLQPEDFDGLVELLESLVVEAFGQKEKPPAHSSVWGPGT